MSKKSVIDDSFCIDDLLDEVAEKYKRDRKKIIKKQKKEKDIIKRYGK